MKKLILTLLVLTIAMQNVTVLAANDITFSDIENRLQDFLSEHNAVLFSLNEGDDNFSSFHLRDLVMPTEMLYFDTIEEFEMFLVEFISMLNVEQDFSFEYPYQGQAVDPFGNFVETWWAPVPFASMFMWRNISYNVRTTNNNIVPTVTVTNSWLHGFHVGISWTHRFGNASAVSPMRRTAEISATGTWLIGADVLGNPIGISWNDTWTRTISV